MEKQQSWVVCFQGILFSLHGAVYNVYVISWSFKFNSTVVGCCINNVLVNHLMYVDDIVLKAPSVKGLQKIMTACHNYETGFNISLPFTNRKLYV